MAAIQALLPGSCASGSCVYCDVSTTSRDSASTNSRFATLFLPVNGIYRKAAIAPPMQRNFASRIVSIRVQAGSSALLAKELERVAAKEDLLLSIKDAGGLRGLPDPEADAVARIDVNEKILALERLNPTPRPTTSPLFEGSWEFQFVGATSPGLIAAQALLKNVPQSLASISALTLVIEDGFSRAVGYLKVLNVVETTFMLTARLEVEGPLKLREEYVEGLLATPSMPEGTVPSQLNGVMEQLSAAVQQLPEGMKDIFSSGVKLPLANTFKRELLISYLDDEVMVARDKFGIPDVLVRKDFPVTVVSTTVVPEYVT
ncbi:hypothetical protein R1sor_017710 [Riccia sorocarpa]|uniref:Plastid lipid-associated protein/fibrillin conserved domain-containing protein n=1 Tax=Riccia sorocarpa TaxID=122646 RepID=A0ABD3I7M3_9MARC